MRDIHQQFIELANSEPNSAELATAVVLLAAIENPTLKIDQCHAQLEQLAQSARVAIQQVECTQTRAALLCDFLHEEQKFIGNQQDYYAPSNSHIDKVLEMRCGIPISLAFLYMYIGDALGWAIAGIGFPGHFLVSVRGKPQALIDPFEGAPLSEKDCVSLIQRAQGADAVLRAEHLRPLTHKAMLQRMLGNLKQNYLQQAGWNDALRILNLLVAIDSDTLRLRYERAIALEKLDCFAAAAQDLREIARTRPQDSRLVVLQEKIQQLEDKSPPKLH
ncbi:MAG: SirB1 family protein [Pseudomonadales bacterium]